MNTSKYIYLLMSLFVAQSIAFGQNLNHYFIKDAYQRSYFNPALNNSGTFAIATGLGLDLNTNGPSIGDLISKQEDGRLFISPADAIAKMDDTNDIFGNSSVNTIDISFNTPIARFSVGHAWKANGWMQYTKHLAEFITFGNGEYVGKTMNLSPKFDYYNYNEIYLGIQRKIGVVSFGARIKRLSGVEILKTNKSKIDLTTSDDIYQLTLETDLEIVASKTFTYNDLDDFSFNLGNISFENFMTSNTGWAFDLGASIELNDRLELSASIIDIGSMDWDVEPQIYTSSQTQTFSGIDASTYINSGDDLVVTDSLDALLNITKSTTVFNTKLPTQIYLGANYKLSDMWSFGAIYHSKGNGDIRTNILGLNATARLGKMLSLGALYSIKNGDATNLGLSAGLHLGPVVAFVSTDNVLQFNSFYNTNSTFRLGLSCRL